MSDNEKVSVLENYQNFTPPVPVQAVVEELLAYVPEKYLAGLQRVELTNTAGLNRHQRREKVWHRNRKHLLRKADGIYHGCRRRRIGWIQVFIDNIFEGEIVWPHWVIWIPFIRKLLIAHVLYHEIGHHIQETKSFENREPENVADYWQKKLAGAYFRRRYWYMIPLIYLTSLFYRKVMKPYFRRKASKSRSIKSPAV